MKDGWWDNPYEVAFLVEWMRNDGYARWVLDVAIQTPWKFAYEYDKANDERMDRERSKP